MKELNNEVWISTPDGVHNNYGLQIYSLNPKDVEKFERLCYKYFIHDGNQHFYHTFYQGGIESFKWKYFEFWKSHLPEVHNKILEVAIEIAKELNLPLNIK